MDNAITRTEPPSAAPSATEEADRDAGMLSRLAELSLDFAGAFQAAGIKAIAADDLDKAGAMETHFSSLALGIRRAIMLKARLREQQQEARRQAEDHRDGRQSETAERRRDVAEGVIRAIDAATPDAETRERLTGDLQTRLDRIDTDRADTILPIEILVRRLCRALGLPPDWPDLPADEAKAAGRAARPDTIAGVPGRTGCATPIPRPCGSRPTPAEHRVRVLAPGSCHGCLPRLSRLREGPEVLALPPHRHCDPALSRGKQSIGQPVPAPWIASLRSQ
jgi:hypothetical protein